MSFDRIAPYYRGMECLLAGEKLQRCRLTWVNEVRDARHILLVGEGHGRFLEQCPKLFPNAQLLCVDASSAMLRLARQRWEQSGGRSGAAEFVQAKLPDWLPPAGEFDLIISHFFLDCFAPPTLERVVERVARAAAPQADWLIADFAVPQQGWRRWRAELVLALAYGFFRRVTALEARQLTAPDGWLRQSGFQLQRRAVVECGLLQSDWWRQPSDEPVRRV